MPTSESTTESKFLNVLATLGPEAVKRWKCGSESDRVALSLLIARDIRAKLGDAAAKEAFAIMFYMATAEARIRELGVRS